MPSVKMSAIWGDGEFSILPKPPLKILLGHEISSRETVE